MSNPFESFEPADRCWCGSGEFYAECHGLDRRSVPGEPVPEDLPDGSIFVAPKVAVHPTVVTEWIRDSGGLPIYAPSKELRQPPQVVPAPALRLAQLEDRVPTLPFNEVARLRFEQLDALGLGDPSTAERRLSTLTSDEEDTLAHAVADTAKATLVRAREQADALDRPSTVWMRAEAPLSTMRRTMLWADHYVIADKLGDAILRGRANPRRFRSEFVDFLRLRPLLETGTLVAIPEDLITLTTHDAVVDTTEADLANPELTSWVMSQLLVEGPTARSVLFVRARDGIELEEEGFFLHGRINPDSLDEETGMFETVMLGAFDSAFDYEPWIDDCRRQTTARLVQQTNRDLAFAEVLGGRLITGSPFQARLLSKRDRLSAPAAAIWADFPFSLDADIRTLARAVQEDEAVEALRAKVRRAFTSVEMSPLAGKVARAEELGAELDEAARDLKRRIVTERRWQAIVPSALAAVSVAVSSSAPLEGMALGAMTALAQSLVPYVATARNRRRQPAFAWLLARGEGRTTKRREPYHGPGFYHLTFEAPPVSSHFV